MNNEDYLSLDATALRQKLRNGEITSSDLTYHVINHNQTLNPQINALVQKRSSQASVAAKRADQAITDHTGTGPLHGIPISVKEALNVTGMKTTGGLVHRQDLIAKTDAAIIKRLKQAGAIIIGKTNTPALCFCQETDNKLYGRTNNPWDLSRTAGGSSGGEGALLAAGGSVAGIGSDIGGSIRFPSHFNGVTGFKPAAGKVDDEGHFPAMEHPLQNRMLGIGPMGKSARDMQMLYQIMSGDEPPEKSLNSFNIEVLPADTSYPLDASGRNMLKQIKTWLELEFPTRFASPPFLEDSAEVWQEIMSIDAASTIKKEAQLEGTVSPWKAFLKERSFANTNHHTYLSWALIGAQIFKPSLKRLMKIKHFIADGDKELNHYLSNRILILPIYHRGAAEHGQVYNEIFSIKKTFLDMMPYTAYANVWGLPALTIPLGRDVEGMPIAVQLISQSGNEHVLFKLGEIIEQGWGGYRRCTYQDEGQHA